MALTNPESTRQAFSGDQSATYILSLSEVLAAILLDDADFISEVGISTGVATQTKHEWDEDLLNVNTALQDGGSSAEQALGTTSGTNLQFSSSQIGRITAGSLLKNQLSGKTEVIQVTAVSGTSATVVRGYGATSAVTHAAAATWDIIANPRPQGMTGPADTSTARTRPHNFTQIFSKGVIVTGTMNAVEHNAIGAEDQYQIDQRLRELKVELDRSAIMGVRAPANVGATTYGTMGGIIDFIGFIDGSNTNGTVETLTPSVVNAMAKQVWDQGGMPTMLLLGGVQKQKVSSFDQEFRRSTLDSRRAGFTVEEFVTDLGMNLRVVVDRWVPNDVAMVLDASRIHIMPLQRRAFFLERLAKTGDAVDWQIVGEYTMEVRNAGQAHAYHFNLKP